MVFSADHEKSIPPISVFRPTSNSPPSNESHSPVTTSASSRGYSPPFGTEPSRTISVDPPPPPDGGVQAWTQALVAHLVVLNTWGFINSFGVFQSYYAHMLPQSASAISWIGSTQVFMIFFVGTVSGRATDAGYLRHTLVLGSCLMLLGVFATSWATVYWQLFLAHGLCTGIGSGLLFCPVLALLTSYFARRRSLALAIAAAGSGTGGLLFPALVEVLLPKVGFAWSIRVLGFVMLALQAVVIALARTRLPPRTSGPLVEWSAFLEPAYSSFAVGMFCVFLGFYFAFYYIATFGRDVLGVSQSQSINLLLVMNGVGIPGRLIPAYCADRWLGPMNVLIPFAFMAGLSLFCWTAVSSESGLIAFAVVYGTFAAGTQGLFPATLTSLTTDLKKTGVRMGMVFSLISFAVLTGPPIAGALIQQDGGKYLHAQVFAASIISVGCMVVVMTRIVKTGPRIAVKI